MNEGFLGQIILFAGNFPPKNWAFCNGQTLSVYENEALYSLLGDTYGGNGQSTFNLPDLRGVVPVNPGISPVSGTSYSLGVRGGTETTILSQNQLPSHNHSLVGQNNMAVSGNITATMNVNNNAQNGSNPSGQYLGIEGGGGGLYANNTDNTTLNADAISVNSGGLTVNGSATQIGNTGLNQPFSNMQPYLPLNYIICTQGVYPQQDMPMDGYLGQIILFASQYAPPTNWEICSGQSIPIAGYEDLYSILGTIYGGNGQTAFKLPDLRGIVPVCAGVSPVSGINYALGVRGGTETTTLNQNQLPAHNHPLIGQNNMSVSGNIIATMKVNNTTQNGSNPSGQYLGKEGGGGGLYANNTDVTTLNADAISVNTGGLTVNGSTMQVSSTGFNNPFSNMQPYLPLKYIICTKGTTPQR
jgi:microcystin-dependent protein